MFGIPSFVLKQTETNWHVELVSIFAEALFCELDVRLPISKSWFQVAKYDPKSTTPASPTGSAVAEGLHRSVSHVLPDFQWLNIERKVGFPTEFQAPNSLPNENGSRAKDIVDGGFWISAPSMTIPENNVENEGWKERVNFKDIWYTLKGENIEISHRIGRLQGHFTNDYIECWWQQSFTNQALNLTFDHFSVISFLIKSGGTEFQILVACVIFIQIPIASVREEDDPLSVNGLVSLVPSPSQLELYGRTKLFRMFFRINQNKSKFKCSHVAMSQDSGLRHDMSQILLKIAW